MIQNGKIQGHINKNQHEKGDIKYGNKKCPRKKTHQPTLSTPNEYCI